MSKRSRKDFESGSSAKSNGRRPKRLRTNSDSNKLNKSNKNKKNHNKKASSLPVSTPNDVDFECSVCYEEFTHHIYQCVEGHLLCHECRPKFKVCPTCRVSLSANIRNRVLEQILSTKNLSIATPKKKKKPSIQTCKLCNESFASLDDLCSHLNECKMRKIECPFIDCKWNDAFSKFAKHSQTKHHTLNGSKLSILSQPNMYTFNHAIKFPKDTFSVCLHPLMYCAYYLVFVQRENADFVWPKIVRFRDGKEFFILSRYTKGFITVFVRLIKLSKLKKNEIKSLMNGNDIQCNDGSGDILGDYWIEFRVKDKSNSSNHNKKIEKEECVNTIPLRWPCKLYGVSVPFDYEENECQVLKVHHSVFTNYWVSDNNQSSAVLRFQFKATVF